MIKEIINTIKLKHPKVYFMLEHYLPDMIVWYLLGVLTCYLIK